MMRYGVSAILLALCLSACGRHHVIPRDAGRVDGDRGLSISSDLEWTVESEPVSTRDDDPSSDEAEIQE